MCFFASKTPCRSREKTSMQALSLRDKRPHEAEVNRAKVRAGLNRLRFYGFIPKNACFFFSVPNRWQAPFSAGVRLPKNRKCWGNKKMIIMWWYSKYASLPNVSWAVLFNIIPLLFGYNEKNWNNYAINMMTVLVRTPGYSTHGLKLFASPKRCRLICQIFSPIWFGSPVSLYPSMKDWDIHSDVRCIDLQWNWFHRS